MSSADMRTGYFGKIPATGDFVSRRLPADFVRTWDRWVSRHLAPALASDIWPDHISLNFLSGPAAFGPMAGILVPSADRVGRRFPLTVAAPLDLVATGLASSAGHWFASIGLAAGAARRGEISADDLEAKLAKLRFPTVETDGETVDGMMFWIDPLEMLDVDLDAPRVTLEQLLAPSWETS